ncbi:cilia- and flagella-associated protein 206 isoform X4 [Gopherus flavomarginatus]|uniref:cilia- and flagella-associated protein 206 isoform X4 n=1 Tax=Gopherus flavomarginatus TaxID=286002 RepID=UPI0021CC382F|nr:cilia- and flagella-associated protein 206 isoform X4 [Gopherus flavomarginatus]
MYCWSRMSHSQAESVIKNIIREIGQECAMKGQTVSETLVAFMVKAVVLDPRNEFNVDRTLTKNDVQKLIKLCVSRLLDAVNPSLDTIKMQVYFDMNYTNRVELLNEQHRVLEARLAPVSREITDNRARTREELESIYRKIVSYVLLRSGLGSPTDIKVVREATAALQSVFPQTELGVFLSLSKKDKERQLKELTMIVTGIRLFNKDCGKGGEGIDDLPAILNEAIPAATQPIDAELRASQDLAYRYTAVLEMMRESSHRNIEARLSMLKEALFNVRQHEAFLYIILSDVITCAQEVEMMDKQFAAQIEQLKNTVQAKTAVPTSQVFPIFLALANLWTSFQDEILLLSFLTNLTGSLQQFLGIHAQLFPDDVMESLLEGVTVKSDEQRIKETMGIKVNVSDFKEQEWLFPETTANFDQLLIQYRGFCAHTLAEKDGLLLPAANFSSLSTLSQRLSQIRWRKKKTQEEMFSEIMEVTRNERAHLNEWKDVIAKYRKDASDREDRRDEREDRRGEREDRRDTRDERRDARVERWQQEDSGGGMQLWGCCVIKLTCSGIWWSFRNGSRITECHCCSCITNLPPHHVP